MELQDEFMAAHSISEILKSQLHQSQQNLHQDLRETILKLIRHRNDKNYLMFVDQPLKYFQLIWNKQVEQIPQIEEIIIPEMRQRYRKVYKDLAEQRLQIQQKHPIPVYDFHAELKTQKILLLRQQSEQIRHKLDQINNNLSQTHQTGEIENDLIHSSSRVSDNEQKRKQWAEIKKKYKQQKQERHNKLKQMKKKEEEDLLKKENQIKQHQEQHLKQKREDIANKLKEQHQLRNKQKAIRQQRNTEYIRIKKQSNNKPPLFKRLENDYNKRYAQVQIEERDRLLSQRKSMFQHIDDMKLAEHQQFYEKIKQERQLKRRQKLQQVSEMEKSRAKFHSSYEITKKVDPRVEERQQAKEKWDKIQQYKQIVKQQYQPKIDQTKRQQLLDLINDIEQGKKKVKKVKQQDGSFIYEEIKPSDPRILGINYLGEVKEMAAKYKLSGKRKASVDLGQHNKQKKFTNYLEQLKANRPQRTKKTDFIDRSNISYQQKIKKVQLQAEKLYEITRQKQEKLKHGKFKTSEQILAYKDQIDQNYMQIVRMKLKLVNKGEGIGIQDVQ